MRERPSGRSLAFGPDPRLFQATGDQEDLLALTERDADSELVQLSDRRIEPVYRQPVGRLRGPDLGLML